MDLVRYLVRFADNGDRFDQLVVDQLTHFVPSPGPSELFGLVMQIAVPVEVEDRSVRRCRGIEGELVLTASRLRFICSSLLPVTTIVTQTISIASGVRPALAAPSAIAGSVS